MTLRLTLAGLAALVVAQLGFGVFTSIRGRVEKAHTTTTVAAIPTPPPIPGPLSISVSAGYVIWGSTVELEGMLESGAVGVTVSIFAKPFGAADWTLETTTTTLAAAPGTQAGTWMIPVVPQLATEYEARTSDLTSGDELVQVGPSLSLIENGPGDFSVELGLGVFDRARTIDIQRLEPEGWRTVRNVRIVSSPNGATHETTRFRLAIPQGTQLRASASRSEIGPEYSAGTSAVLVVSG